MTLVPNKDPKVMTPQERRLMLADFLDSGEYDQTTGQLRVIGYHDDRPEGYCCLGVACDLYLKFSGDSEVEWNGEAFRVNFTGEEDEEFDERDGDLPERVRQWFDFVDANASAPDLPHGAKSLIILNDGDPTGAHGEETFHAEPFSVIAQVIRERF